MLIRKTAIYSENRMQHMNTLCGQNAYFYVLIQVVYMVITGL
jgi:hypothetical protein